MTSITSSRPRSLIIQIVATFEADEDFTAIREVTSIIISTHTHTPLLLPSSHHPLPYLQVGGVSHYVHRMVERRRRGENACTNLLVVAGPAAGKTCMTSQLVMEAFRRDDSGKVRQHAASSHQHQQV